MSGSPYSVAAVSGLLLSSLVLESNSQPHDEVFTEAVCWLLILGAGKLYFSRFTQKPRQFDATGLMVIALGATLLCLSSSVLKTVWTTVSNNLHLWKYL
jgi:hypothetical protein